MTPDTGYRVSRSRAGDAVARRRRTSERRRVVGAAWRSLLSRLGVRPERTIDGVRYRAGSTMSLERALGPDGPGILTYDVTFPPRRDGSGPAMVPKPMRIRATRERIYADLVPCRRVTTYKRFASRVRPGSRLLEVGCGTGGGTGVLARLVGPSGAVLAVGEDHESVRYARRRYGAANVGFELLNSPRRVPSEPDGAFDAVAAIDQTGGFRDTTARQTIAELWRLVRPGGWLLLSEQDPGSSRLDPMADPDTRDAVELVRSACAVVADVESVGGQGEITVVATRAGEAREPEPRAEGPAG